MISSSGSYTNEEKLNALSLLPSPYLPSYLSLWKSTDRSKYGTVISRSGSFTDEVKLEGGAETRVQAGWMLRFGFKSPFKLVLQARAYLPICLQAACLLAGLPAGLSA